MTRPMSASSSFHSTLSFGLHRPLTLASSFLLNPQTPLSRGLWTCCPSCPGMRTQAVIGLLHGCPQGHLSNVPLEMPSFASLAKPNLMRKRKAS